MRRLIFPLVFICVTLTTQAQHILGMRTVFANDLSEWTLIPEDQDLPECNIRARWRWQDDPSEWDFRMGELSGVVRQKWKGRMDEWEVIADNKVTRLRMVWPGDPREWRIESSDKEYVIQSKYNIAAGDWLVKDRKESPFVMYPAYELDPRDWIIEDNLDEDVHITVRIALCFAVMITNVVK